MHSVIRDGKPVEPTKIVCIGRNYAEHIKEFDNEASQEPCIFLKPNSSIANDVIASDAELIHYEGEISFLIEAGKLRAVGFGLDLTKRDLQYELKNRGWPWERAKAFDNAAVFSEFVSYEGDTRDLRLEFYINDELIQFGDYALMLSKPEQLLADCKTFMTFEDGDLLMTGTPRGVGPVKRGDQYVGKIHTNDTLLVEGAWTVK
jgi:2-keto-4-pentenoate hydratase/2-oxohepta-3-ene-1,7-dioic acid hydratase in catechol pathway